MSIGLIIAFMVLLFALNVPIYISMICAVVAYFVQADINVMIMIQKMMGGVQKTSLLAIPFFIMSGICMNYGGITAKLMTFCEKVTGHMPGGLAQVNVLLSTLMGGLSGSCVADAAMQSKILYPEMVKRNYGEGFSAAVTAASALITPIIPPGISMITYSLVANVSVGRVFAAGVIPGIILCVTQMLICNFVARRNKIPPIYEKRQTVKEIAKSGKSAIFAILMPIIIIGGIRSGIFTAAETGAICCLYAIFIGAVVYRKFTFKHLRMALQETAIISLSVLLIFGAAQGFAYMISTERVSAKLADFVLSICSTPWQFMIVVILILIFLGCFMEGGALTIMLVPLLVPICESLGIDLVYFGIVYVVTIVFGTLTPPVGSVMYTVCNITGVKTKEFCKSSLPFYIGFGVDLLLFTLIPDIILWLPNLIYG